jgi:hypothetical protein
MLNIPYDRIQFGIIRSTRSKLTSFKFSDGFDNWVGGITGHYYSKIYSHGATWILSAWVLVEALRPRNRESSWNSSLSKSTKMPVLIRNLPFQWLVREIAQLEDFQVNFIYDSCSVIWLTSSCSVTVDRSPLPIVGRYGSTGSRWSLPCLTVRRHTLGCVYTKRVTRGSCSRS